MSAVVGMVIIAMVIAGILRREAEVAVVGRVALAGVRMISGVRHGIGISVVERMGGGGRRHLMMIVIRLRRSLMRGRMVLLLMLREVASKGLITAVSHRLLVGVGNRMMMLTSVRDGGDIGRCSTAGPGGELLR